MEREKVLDLKIKISQILENWNGHLLLESNALAPITAEILLRSATE